MRKTVLYFAFCFLLFVVSNNLFGQKDYTSLVNPFIGTGGHGHTYPGASMPFGMMQLSPDTRLEGWDGCSGYHYSDSVIYGFSHTHLSGTGIEDYCDILFMPFAGAVQWDNKNYRSTFSHKNEKASPGYYEVLLDRQNIKAQLATSYRSGMHQYIFPQSEKDGSVLIDLKHRDEVLDSYIEKVNDHEIKGYRKSRSWAQNQTVFFYIQFEKPIREFEINDDGKELISVRSKQSKNMKAFVRFNLAEGKTIRCRIGISGVSMDGALLNLKTEINDWDFDKVKNKAKQSWNEELSKIDIKGGTKDQQITFYTALYHTFLVPNIYKDVDSYYRGTDLKVHVANGFTNYTVFSLWDTYRAYHPLMTIINQKRTSDWIKTFLAQYQYGGMLPMWELSGNETFCMIGYHSVPVIVDAYQKGIRDFDAKLALKAMQSYAESDRFGLKYYRENGYLSNDKESESVSKTLEYAYDDWCIAQFAKMLGVDSVYKKYIQRAQSYKNVFDPQTQHMRGKMQGIWYSPFDPKEINNFYTEGNSWQYTFAVPQDIETLIQLYSGEEGFAKKLNELFTTSSQTTGREQSDVTGLIGQYAHGNEPSHHMAYLFNYVKQPWRTQEYIHKICTEFYKNDPDGLIGNEDCGQMSAWYVLSAMGIYEVCPGSGEYILGTPLFDVITINLENTCLPNGQGKKFVIKAKRNKPGEKYIAATKLNGMSSTKSYLLHTDIMKGGELDFILSNQQNKKWGTKDADLPHSKITDEQIVSVPYFDVKSNKFRDNVDVKVRDIDRKAEIHFKGANQEFKWTKNSYYELTINETCEVSAFSEVNGKKSKEVRQKFYKLPSDKTITILSKVNSMYTAGGPDALIDGIEGTTNWRAGEWQGYYDQDFEAIIDLQKTKQVNYVGVHVLQDVSPWILYPKEVIFYTSNDGKNFTEAAKVQNNVEQKLEPAQMQELGTNVNFETRYLKVKAINGGKLPSWHESASNPSHLFIDEVIIK